MCCIESLKVHNFWGAWFYFKCYTIIVCIFIVNRYTIVFFYSCTFSIYPRAITLYIHCTTCHIEQINIDKRMLMLFRYYLKLIRLKNGFK